jgi:hypothetical protein
MLSAEVNKQHKIMKNARRMHNSQHFNHKCLQQIELKTGYFSRFSLGLIQAGSGSGRLTIDSGSTFTKMMDFVRSGAKESECAKAEIANCLCLAFGPEVQGTLKFTKVTSPT